MKLHIPDMSCGHCTAAVTKTVQALDGAAVVTTDLTTRQAQIDTNADLAAVQAALAAAGYPATAL